MLILETIVVFFLMSLAAVYLHSIHLSSTVFYLCYIPLLLFQGLWFYRLYIVGHEASHKKLFPSNSTRNDFWGAIVLLPLMVPITIFRKIHYYHHGFNRKDDHTSALDTFVIKGNYQGLKKVSCYFIWYLSVFCGGFFIHSLVSVVLFLFVPPSLSVKISPAFKGWTFIDQLKSIALFLSGVLFHLSVFYFLGKEIYFLTLALPLLSFAWVLSMLVYIFHFDTTKGDQVRYNVRSVEHIPFFSWLLMNFNEHATHHQYPNIPWYELPSKRKKLPEEYENKNQLTRNFFKAIFNQLKGPIIIYEQANQKG